MNQSEVIRIGKTTAGLSHEPPEKKQKPIHGIECDDGLVRPPWAATDVLLKQYYDTEWGMPVRDEHGLFERLSLEVFQAGLSWATILKKRENLRLAFECFDPDKVACFQGNDIARLMSDPGGIRNKTKIAAIISNAVQTIRLRGEGGLANLIWSFRPSATLYPSTMADIPTTSPESLALSRALRKKGFSYVGPTTIFALMEAIGMVDTHLLSSHRRGSSGVWKVK